MPFSRQTVWITALLFAVVLTASLSNLPADAMFGRRADPPVFVTNLSGAPVELQWQTVQPNTALSPVRGATIPEGATEALAEDGLFWFYDPADGGAVENIVFVSIVDANGAILSQVVMEEEIAGTLETVEETALHITIEMDGKLTLAIQETE